MIPQILWPAPRFDEFASPFQHGRAERPLRITFHSASFAGASPQEAEAIQALRELSKLPEIEALDTEVGPLPQLEIGRWDDQSEVIPVAVSTQEGRRYTGVDFPAKLAEIAARLVGHTSTDHPEAKAMFTDLVTARAHASLGNDVLVTLSPRILVHRAHPQLHEANPHIPSEAARVTGLFLRTRDNYTWRVQHRARHKLDRGLFYWVLVRHRLPNMWRYFSACVYSAKLRQDDIERLGESVLVRCQRSLQARDAIGEQFYLPQGNNARDQVMYHFNYLTLLLSGALDAQARVAHRAYGVKRPTERYAGFRRPDFPKTLEKHGATALFALINSQHSRDVMTLLYDLRNTIHGAGPSTFAYQDTTSPQQSFVTVPSQLADELWQVAERCGSADQWGLSRKHGVHFEPYAYSARLVAECLSLVDGIAATTDTTRLFADGNPVPALDDTPPDDDVFGERIRRRLAVLG